MTRWLSPSRRASTRTENRYDIQIYDEGIIGCGVSRREGLPLPRHRLPEWRALQPGPAAPRLLPVPPVRDHAVPVVARRLGRNGSRRSIRTWWSCSPAGGRWSTARTRRANGRTSSTRQYASYVEQQLRARSAGRDSEGAKMVIETAPCYSSGEQPNGDPWPEDSTRGSTSTTTSCARSLPRPLGRDGPGPRRRRLSRRRLQRRHSTACQWDRDGVHFVNPVDHRTERHRWGRTSLRRSSRSGSRSATSRRQRPAEPPSSEAHLSRCLPGGAIAARRVRSAGVVAEWWSVRFRRCRGPGDCFRRRRRRRTAAGAR